MAEFTEVMRQAKRMCTAHGGMCNSRNCPLDNGEACRLAADQDGEDYSDVERIIMAWAAEHPVPRYPTWWEWQHSMFPDANANMYPCSFLSYKESGCTGSVCDECCKRQIPADIAAKLGIKPIDPDRFSCNECRYRGKPVLEEPCARCRRAEAPGSVGWAEMPDLWEVVPDDN